MYRENRPYGLIFREDYNAALVALVATAKLLPAPDTTEARAYRRGYLAGLAAAATAAGIIKAPGLDRLILSEAGNLLEQEGRGCPEQYANE